MIHHLTFQRGLTVLVEEDTNKPLQEQCQTGSPQAIGKGALPCSSLGYSECENTQTSLVSTAPGGDLGMTKKCLPYSAQQHQAFAFETEQNAHGRGPSSLPSPPFADTPPSHTPLSCSSTPMRPQQSHNFHTASPLCQKENAFSVHSGITSDIP